MVERPLSTTINLKSESVENYFKFHVDAMNKGIILYSKNGHTLNYAIMNDKKNVEFYYPSDDSDQSEEFTYNKETGSVSFENKNYLFTPFYDKSGKLGINITYKGKTHQWVGNPKSRKGSIGKLLRVSWIMSSSITKWLIIPCCHFSNSASSHHT